MNEVRDIFVRMLDSPEPPMRPADEVLGVARRASGRRGWRGAASAGAAVVAIVMAVGLLASPGWVGRKPSSVGAGTPAVQAPPARASASHGARMGQVLLAAISDGYTPAPVMSFSASQAVKPIEPVPAAGRIRLLAAAVLRVFQAAGEGRLFAYVVYDGQPVPDGDVCAAMGGAGAGETCEVIVVEGVPIRVVASTDSQRGQTFEATRFLDGGRLTVGAWQGIPLDPTSEGAIVRWDGLPWSLNGDVIWRRPALATALLDKARVAAIAGDPAMLPMR